MKLKNLDYVVLIATDLEASVRFYADTLGLPISHRAADFVQFDTGTTRLALFSDEAMAATLGRAPVRGSGGEAFEIGFFVDDCDAAYAELRAAGVSTVAKPTNRAWGQRTAYVADPDGNLVELVQKLPAGDDGN